MGEISKQRINKPIIENSFVVCMKIIWHSSLSLIVLQFNDMVTVIFMSHTTVAALVAFILDITLSREDDAARKDSGLQWWEKFSLYSADVRSDEFYALPCRLDALFPAL